MNSSINDVQVKLNLKVGSVEIAFEGNEAFLKDHVLDLIERALSGNPRVMDSPSDHAASNENKVRELHNLAINSVASILEVDSGPDLIVAAAAHLELIQGKEKFTRSDLRQEIRSATSFFKSSYTSNLSSYITSLVKSEQLHEIGQDTYALPEARKRELRALLDEHR